MKFVPIILLCIVLFFGAMYAAFRALTIKIDDIIKDIAKGMKIREEILNSMLSILKTECNEEYIIIKEEFQLLNKQSSLNNPKDVVNYDEKLEKVVLYFLAISQKHEKLKENFNFVELTIRLKDLETRIVNEKHRYNGIVEKYNFRRENASGKFFSNLYGFKKEEKLYISEEIVEFLNSK